MPSERSSTVFRVWSSACGGQLHPALVRRRTHAMVLDRPRRSARRRACRLRSPSLSTRRKKPANLPLLQPTAAQGLRHPEKKKKTRDGRPLDRCGPEVGGSFPLWSSLELPLPRCAASIPRLLGMLFTVFRSIDGRSSNFDRRLEGRGKQKKCCFGFWGGWVGLQKKKKKRRVFYTPREWTAPTEAAEPARDPGPLSKQLFRKTL